MQLCLTLIKNRTQSNLMTRGGFNCNFDKKKTDIAIFRFKFCEQGAMFALRTKRSIFVNNVNNAPIFLKKKISWNYQLDKYQHVKIE